MNGITKYLYVYEILMTALTAKSTAVTVEWQRLLPVINGVDCDWNPDALSYL